MDPDLEFSARLADRRGKAIVVAAGAVLVLGIGFGLLADGDGDRRTSELSSSATETPGATTRRTADPPVARATPAPDDLGAGPDELSWRSGPASPIEPGPYYIAWDTARVRLTIPAGWQSTDRGATLVNAQGRVTLHIVADPLSMRVATDVCPLGEDATFSRTRLRASDLVNALVSQAGIVGPDPVDVVVGTFPATKIVRTDLLCRGGPEGRGIWREGDLIRCPRRRVLPCPSGATGFGLLFGGTATIYVVDVSGQRLVLATAQRGATPEEIAEVDAVVASIEIEPAGPVGRSYLETGRRPVAADGMPISFVVPVAGWEYHDGLSLTRPLEGVDGQTAEAIVYWTRPSGGPSTDPCTRLVGPSMGTTVAEIADAVATAPDTELLAGPLDVSVGGRPAKSVVIRVLSTDRSCDPGFFYTWPYVPGGGWWSSTEVGDTIRVWIVDVDGSPLLIAGEVRWYAGFGRALTGSEQAGLEHEIDQLIASVTFD